MTHTKDIEVNWRDKYYNLRDEYDKLLDLITKVKQEVVREFYKNYISNVNNKQALLDDFVEYVYSKKARNGEFFPEMLVGWWHDQVRQYLSQKEAE